MADEKISKIRDKVSLFTNCLYQLEIIDTDRFPENYEQMSLKAIRYVEQLACSMRHFVYHMVGTSQQEILKIAAEEQGIIILAKPTYYIIELQGLIPKKGTEKNSRYIADPLFYSLNEYYKNNELKKYRECVVCFMHIYNKTLPQRRIRDYDNLELKQVLDVIAIFFLEDDNGKCCDMFHTTYIGDKDCVRIYIMEKSNFPNWLVNQEKGLLIG